MTLRLATFNVENLFERAKALNTTTWAQGQPVLQAFERFNTLANNPIYSDADKQAMLEALETLQVLRRSPTGALRLNRDPFSAWALLRRTAATSSSSHNPATCRSWRRGVGLDRLGGAASRDCGCDRDRGGLDPQPRRRGRPRHTRARPLFSRDCPLYQLRLPSGADLWVVLNHLKSQSFTSGNPDPLRSRQSAEMRHIYDRLRDQGAELVAVMGDFNKGPTNDQPPQHPTLEPLLGPGSPLVDATTLPGFDPGRVRAPSSRAACATASTTSCSHPNWRALSPPGRSSARACGAPDQQEPADDLDGLSRDHHGGAWRVRHAAVWVEFDL